MKGLLSGLVLWSGCLAGVAAAQEVRWRPAAPEVTIGQPRPISEFAAGPGNPPSSPVISTAVYRPEATPPRIIRLKSESVESVPTPAAVTPPPVPNFWGGFAGDQPGGLPPGDPVHPDGAMDLPDAFGPGGPRFYGRAEYLLWWLKEARVPPLVTTGPPDPSGQSGVLGRPGTVLLFGGSEVGGDVRSGGRLTLGYWCDDARTMGVEGSFFLLGQRSFRFAANSLEFPVLARPFFSLNAMAESAQVATAPGLAAGSVAVEGPSRLWGAEADFRYNLCCGCLGRLDLLAGFRYLELDEQLHVTESLLGLAGAGAFAGSRIQVSDRFDTRNQFYGPQAGLDYELTYGRWSLDVRGKLALGNTHQVVNIAGEQVIVAPTGAITVANGGLLALATNSGHFTRDRFAVLPEVGLTLGCQVTDWCRLSVGYNFLYLSSVVRPGDQIDRVLDVTQIPNFPVAARPTGALRPAAPVRDTDFWAQGINLGVEFRY
jgi:hypothetical protein